MLRLGWGVKQMEKLNIAGFEIYPGWLNPEDQAALVSDVRAMVRAAPLFHPVTPPRAANVCTHDICRTPGVGD